MQRLSPSPVKPLYASAGRGINDDSGYSKPLTGNELESLILAEFSKLTNYLDAKMWRLETLIKGRPSDYHFNGRHSDFYSLSGLAVTPSSRRFSEGFISSDLSVEVGSTSSGWNSRSHSQRHPSTTGSLSLSPITEPIEELSCDSGIIRDQSVWSSLEQAGVGRDKSSMSVPGREKSNTSGLVATTSTQAVSAYTTSNSKPFRASVVSAVDSKDSCDPGTKSWGGQLTTVSHHDLRRRRTSLRVAESRLFFQSSMRSEKLEAFATRIYMHPLFEPVFAWAVLINGFMIGVEVEFASKDPHRKTSAVFHAFTHTFALIFLIELLLRLFAEGWSFWTSKTEYLWNYFDLFLVLSSIFELCVDIVSWTSKQEEGNELTHSTNLRVVRLLRITRIIRIVRLVRVVRFVRALRTLVYSIVVTLKSLLWALLLLLIINYIFGIVFTQAVTHQIENQTEIDQFVMLYWSSLPRSMFTLFKTVSGGVTWQDAAYPLSRMHWSCVPLFIIYVSFMQFAMINVLTGVFCQSAIESANHDYEVVAQSQLANMEMYARKLQELFSSIDRDSSGDITIDEFEQHLGDKDVQAYFNALELDASDVWTLFKLLDKDEDHCVDVSEFLYGCIRLRGHAKAIEIAKMAYDNKVHRKRMNKFMVRVEGALGCHGPRASLGPLASLDLQAPVDNSDSNALGPLAS